jgi:putative heme-binding domain-containing protein
MFATDRMWANAAGRANGLRLIRRFAAEGTQACYDACIAMLNSAPGADRMAALEHLRQGLAERAVGLSEIGQGDLFVDQAATGGAGIANDLRKYEPVKGALRDYVEAAWRAKPDEGLRLELALRAGIDGANKSLSSGAFDRKRPSDVRVQRLQLMREFAAADSWPQLVELVLSNEPEAVRLAALEPLANSEASEAVQSLLAEYAKLPPGLRTKVCDVLVSRSASAFALLEQVDRGAIAANALSIEQLRRLALHEDEDIDALVRKHWGNIGPGSPEEKLATMRRYNNDLRAGVGDESRGKELFAKHCATCHQLNGEGNKIGPDLTTANRSDRAALLGNIVDPSAVVRREFMSFVVITKSGRVHAGVITEQDGASVTIVDAENKSTKLLRDEIDTLEEADVSLMPERILDGLTPQQIRDMFAYIQNAPAT